MHTANHRQMSLVPEAMEHLRHFMISTTGRPPQVERVNGFMGNRIGVLLEQVGGGCVASFAMVGMVFWIPFF